MMKRLMCTLTWFFGLSIVAKLLFEQPLGYFWFVIVALSIFFGIQSVRQLDLEGTSLQLSTWLNTYQDLSYFKQQLYLSEVISSAIKSNQTKQALEFLDRILKAEPDNETVKSLMASIWGAELINQYNGGNLSR